MPKTSIYLLIGVLRLISILPLPVCYGLGKILGEITYWMHASRRRITHRNLSACFPQWAPNQIRRISRAHFHHMVIGFFTMTIAWWASEKRLTRLVQFHHREYLDKCIKQENNIILLAPHFTNLEILGITLFSQYRMVSMYRRHNNPNLDKLIRQHRNRFNVALYTHKESLRSMIKAVRNGTPLYYLPDQDPGSKGVFVPFFDIQTSTYTSLGKLAKLGKAVVVPCMAKITAYGLKIDIIFDPPMEKFPGGDSVEDAATMNKAIENLISIAPEQYFWSHKRFKTRPKGEKPFYS